MFYDANATKYILLLPTHGEQGVGVRVGRRQHLLISLVNMWLMEEVKW